MEKEIFEWEVPDDFPNISGDDDIPRAYKVAEVKQANSGIVVYCKYDGDWIANPWSYRPLIRELIKRLNQNQHGT